MQLMNLLSNLLRKNRYQRGLQFRRMLNEDSQEKNQLLKTLRKRRKESETVISFILTIFSSH